MNYREATKRCACGCCRLTFNRYEVDDEPLNYAAMFETDYIDGAGNSFWIRVKSAAKLLFGKRYCHAEVMFETKEEYLTFLEECRKLADDE